MTYKEDTNFNLFDLKATCIYIENQIIALIPKSHITKVDNKKPIALIYTPMRLITLSSCRREIRYLMAQKFPWQVPCAEENLGLGIEHTANSQSAALIKQTIKQGLKKHGSCSSKHLEIAFRGTNFKQLRSVECQTTTRKKKKRVQLHLASMLIPKIINTASTTFPPTYFTCSYYMGMPQFILISP